MGGGGYVFELLFMIKLNVPIILDLPCFFYKLIIFCEDPGSVGKILYSISFLTKNALKQTRSTMGSSRYSKSEKNEI